MGSWCSPFRKVECLQRALRPLPEHNQELEIQKLNLAKQKTLSNSSTVKNPSITTHPALQRLQRIQKALSSCQMPSRLSGKHWIHGGITFLAARRLALLDLSIVQEKCPVLLSRTRLFLTLRQSQSNVVYDDSWRFIQFAGFVPKTCTALGTYFPLSISNLATSKSPDSSACKSIPKNNKKSKHFAIFWI